MKRIVNINGQTKEEVLISKLQEENMNFKRQITELNQPLQLQQTCVMQSVLKNQVRIGNFVYFNEKIETVYAIRNSGVDFYRGKTKKSVIMQSYVWEVIKPIPLTEKWLIGFNFNFKELGFPELSVSHHLFGNKFYFHIQNYAKEIFFVHELQNLYFTLTQRELTVA
jgi:hypothetical protein